MWNIPPKQLAYTSFYYFFIIFWVACIFYDVFNESITGFTFGYFFALFYFIARARDAIRDLEALNDHEPED